MKNSNLWCALLVPVLLGQCPFYGTAKEIEVTKEWTKLGENDTIPAGMHIKIDMTTGEKFVKLMDDDNGEEESLSTAAAIIHEDGSVETVTDNDKLNDHHRSQYDFEMMHRTLSKLPDEEKERMGGIPELPENSKESAKLTAKERELFEKRLKDIWEKRQEELKELQKSLLDVPQVLRERITSIKDYLKDPSNQLKAFDLEDEPPQGRVTHIVSVLQDLEFQLNDVDMTRDFHTLGGWQLLVSLVSEDVHVPQNKTISKLPRKTEAKIRAIQAHAAWAIGSAVKNTGEFFPYAIEPLQITGKDTKTTAIELLIDTFCREYKDSNTWEVRTLLTKTVYAIGSLLRGNRIAQARIIQSNKDSGPIRLGDKLRQLSLSSYSSTNVKLIQRLMSLASDVVADIQLHGDVNEGSTNDAITESFTTSDWCNSISEVLVSDNFVPVPVQETLLASVEVLAPYCDWDEKVDDHKTAIENMVAAWKTKTDHFDDEHLLALQSLASKASEAVGKAKDH